MTAGFSRPCTTCIPTATPLATAKAATPRTAPLESARGTVPEQPHAGTEQRETEQQREGVLGHRHREHVPLEGVVLVDVAGDDGSPRDREHG